MSPELQQLLQVAMAMGLGALIGLERETADKPAGLRTHMLVSGAAALLVGLGRTTLTSFGAGNFEPLRADPIRIIEAVVTGVSFLGAGTIIRSGGSVHGLTTAASLLMSSAVGVAVAMAQLILACGVVALTIVTLRVVPAVERFFRR